MRRIASRILIRRRSLKEVSPGRAPWMFPVLMISLLGLAWGCNKSQPADDPSAAQEETQVQNDAVQNDAVQNDGMQSNSEEEDGMMPEEDPDSLQDETVQVPPPERFTTQSGAADDVQGEEFDPPRETP